MFERKGVTLIEILVVLAVMGIIAGISIPLFSVFARGNKLDGAARNISTALRTARSYAIVKRAVYTVDLTTDDKFFIVGVDKTFKMPVGIKINNVSTVDDQVEFNADGSLNETGTVTITIRQTLDSIDKIIAVYRTTGAVRVND